MTVLRLEPEPRAEQQRFRTALISAICIHVATLAAALVIPMLSTPNIILMSKAVPVRLVNFAPEPPASPSPIEPEMVIEDQAQQEPEPESQVPTEKELRQLKRERQRETENESRRQEEAERQRQAADEKSRQRAEAAKPKRQTASRSERQTAPPQTQSARRIQALGAGEKSNITVEDFPFAYYLEGLRQRIAQKWAPPSRSQYSSQQRTVLVFRIDRTGKLVAQQVLESSGDPLYDQAAQRAVLSTHFSPLPREYRGHSLGVRFAFIQE